MSERGMQKRRCLKEVCKTIFRDHKEISKDDQVVWEWWEEERFDRRTISIANYQEKVEGHVKPESKFEADLIKAIESMFYFSAKE